MPVELFHEKSSCFVSLAHPKLSSGQLHIPPNQHVYIDFSGISKIKDIPSAEKISAEILRCLKSFLKSTSSTAEKLLPTSPMSLFFHSYSLGVRANQQILPVFFTEFSNGIVGKNCDIDALRSDREDVLFAEQEQQQHDPIFYVGVGMAERSACVVLISLDGAAGDYRRAQHADLSMYKHWQVYRVRSPLSLFLANLFILNGEYFSEFYNAVFTPTPVNNTDQSFLSKKI